MKKMRAFALILLIFLTTSTSRALNLVVVDPEQQWSLPLVLFETQGRASEAEVVADPSGTIHVFWAYDSENDDEFGTSQAIYYMRHQNGQWSVPVDVLVSPGNRVARMHSVVADTQGNLHIVWSGSDTIFYSQAHVLDADNATAWTAPKALESRVSVAEPSIATDNQGHLYAVWTQEDSGLMFSRSDDGGSTWLSGEPIFFTDPGDLARWGRIAVDDIGRLHVVLTQVVRSADTDVVGEGEKDPNYLYYIRSDDSGETWTRPFLISQNTNFGEVNVVTEGEDTVHLVWNGRAGYGGRYHRWSQDGGQTWSDEVAVMSTKSRDSLGWSGLTGFPALVTDITGALHMISATGGGDYYFQWVDGDWSDPIYISPNLDGDGISGTIKSLEQPSIALSEGNKLHVVFHDGFERIWYTESPINAPHQPPTALPTRAIASTSAAPTEAPLMQELTPVPVLFEQGAPPSNSLSTLKPFLLASAASTLLVGYIVWIYGTRRSK